MACGDVSLLVGDDRLEVCERDGQGVPEEIFVFPTPVSTSPPTSSIGRRECPFPRSFTGLRNNDSIIAGR